MIEVLTSTVMRLSGVVVVVVVASHTHQLQTQLYQENNSLNITGVMEGVICPTFHHTYNINIDAAFATQYRRKAVISALGGLYKVVVTPDGTYVRVCVGAVVHHC